MKISFKAKVWRFGDTNVLTIPKAYVDNRQIELKEYLVELSSPEPEKKEVRA